MLIVSSERVDRGSSCTCCFLLWWRKINVFVGFETGLHAKTVWQTFVWNGFECIQNVFRANRFSETCVRYGFCSNVFSNIAKTFSETISAGLSKRFLVRVIWKKNAHSE